jgi:PHD/YefM family antitoxin component YafN of YafNO toxin-antitoxin module
MLTLHPEYVIDDHQETKAVLLPFDEWQQLLEALEELEDIRTYDEVKAQKGEYIPFEQAVQEIQSGEK